ncbi:hypothetical protein HYDPIDRAFT_93917 [Hydnomerulius pinastri MD-312]|uniref:FIST domain-containing protein n=1 Tax=Hydnomerulius pinastri MD-312 TaxID=994086 RepID=A0A0C9W6U9_9AGAM|nr:hypothetical protein HYDPIDRAFT_93917 [Hydnomerulius pinastri MD-312]
MPTSRHLSNATTFLARCPSSLINALSSTLERNSGLRTITKNHTLLFTIAPSSTTSPELLSQLTSALTRISPAHVGCISAPLSHQFFGSNIHPGHNACSFSYALVNGTSFRSTIPGRAEPQVGRWHAGRRRSTDHEGLERESGGTGVDVEHAEARVFADGSGAGGEVDWEKVWDRSARSMSFGMWSERSALPDTLKNIDPSTVDNIIYFSDRAPEGISSVLDSAFPRANKLSLIASSTPFLTGRPVTLFHNGEVLSDGAVGVALSASSSSPSVDLSFPPLVALTPELVVTSAEGNLILSLDSGNPTRLLLAAIQKHGLSLSGGTTWVGKEDEFYVGVVDPQTNEITQLHRINSGDPSRGTIALDTGSAPRKGCVVRVCSFDFAYLITIFGGTN